jgi:hypothetical protein
VEFRIADTFTDSLARLGGDEQKARFGDETGRAGSKWASSRRRGYDTTAGSPARSASGQGIFCALVQPSNSVAVESLLSDFQLGRRKKFGLQFLDREADGIRRAGKSSVPDGLPHPPPPGRK